jgi:hypothetical protein
MTRRAVGPSVLVLAGVVGGWLVTSVSALDIIKFLAYDIGFVALPGAALLWAVRGHRSNLLVTLALGWPLGQTLEILAFSGTAWINSRGAFLAYPLVVILGCAAVIWRRQRGVAFNDEVTSDSETEPPSSAVLWTAAGVLVVGLIYLTLEFLPLAPLPGASVTQEYQDYPYFIGLITQAMHHWPPNAAGLSGVPLAYEWFVLFHIAAASQVTHIPVPIIGLRLDYIPTIVVVGCQLLAVGHYIGRSWRTGVVALMLLLLLAPPDFSSNYQASPDIVFVHLWDSWTFPFGLTFMLALLYLVTERLRATSWRGSGDLRAWALIVLLLIGASGAKATILPDIMVGAVIYAVLHLVFRRGISKPVITIFVVTLIVFVPTYIIIYGGYTPGTKLQLLEWLTGSTPVVFAHLIQHTTLRAVALPLAYVLGFCLVMAPLSGILYMLRRRHRATLAKFAFPLCMYAAGVLIAATVHHSSGSELYFQDTGYVAACIVSAAGLRLAWLDLGYALPFSRGAVVVGFVAWLLLLIAIVKITEHSVGTPQKSMLRYAGIGALVILFIIAGALVALSQRRSASSALALGLVPIIAASALTTPLAVYPNLQKAFNGEPISSTNVVLEPGMVSALNWLRDHTPINAVIAVNNHWTSPSRFSSKFYYYSAFSDRQVFIEQYNPYPIPADRSTPASRDFIFRQRLNDVVFNHADANALQAMIREYDVRYLLIDRRLGGYDPTDVTLGHVVLSNQDAIIIAVGA